MSGRPRTALGPSAAIAIGLAFVAGGAMRLMGVGVTCPESQPMAEIATGRYVVEEVVSPGDLQMYSAVIDLDRDQMVVDYDREDGSSWRIVYAVTARTVETLR